MINTVFKGIFGHFFSRALLMLAGLGLTMLAFVLPYMNYIADGLSEAQGNTFANSTLTNTQDALFKQDIEQVILICTKILQETPTVSKIIYTEKNGREIIIEATHWSVGTSQHQYHRLSFKNTQKVAFVLTHPIAERSSEQSFIYHQKVFNKAQYWGVLSIEFSKQGYIASINNAFYWLISFTILASLTALTLLYLSSKAIRQQIGEFEGIAKQLSAGQLDVRANEQAVGEIGALGQAINKISSTLKNRSERLHQMAQIVEQTNDAFILFDANLKVIFANDAIEYETKYPAFHLIGLTASEFAHILHMDANELLLDIDWVKNQGRHTPTRDVVMINKFKKPVDVEIRLELIDTKDPEQPNFLLVISNIASRKALENELHHLAYFDKLTNLPNRHMFIEQLSLYVKRARQRNKSFALLFIDLDNFKFLNDSLGHEVGDAYLVQVGMRLQSIYRSGDIVTRIGGDEFTVLIEDDKIQSNIVLSKIAEKLVKTLAEEPILVAGRSLSVSASVGVAVYPRDGHDSDTLLRNADTAMYTAKRMGKNRFVLFDSSMSDLFSNRLEMEFKLKQAITVHKNIQLHFQPIVDLANKQAVGAECLARWHDKEKGNIPPNEFIEVAEKSNLIIQLSEYLLHIAFKQAEQWHTVKKDFYLSVNISVPHFETQGFVAYMKDLLKQYDVPAKTILLEFTESIMLDASQETIQKFDQLKTIGFKIAIDDFGTGYSSLGYIHQLPIDIIKIDRSFINNMLENNKSKAIVAAVSKLSGTLGLKTIAEGIEQIAQAESLGELECGFGQGYLFSKALPAIEFEARYINNNAKTLITA